MGKPTVVTDKDFEQTVLKSKTATLVDFWAAWCGPCRMLSPVVEELATEYEGKIQVVKLNVDENPGTAQKYSILSIPTLILFKDGKPFKQMVGFRQKAELKKDLDAALPPTK